MSREKDAKWQALLKNINTNLETERKILKKNLRQKIDELGGVKEESNKAKKINLSINKTREDRIRNLEMKLEEEKRKSSILKTKNNSLAEEGRVNGIRLDQLERENYNFQLELKNKVVQINQLRMELLPRYGLSKKTSGSGRMDKLENSIKDTENFYKEMSQRIDKILRY